MRIIAAASRAERIAFVAICCMGIAAYAGMWIAFSLIGASFEKKSGDLASWYLLAGSAGIFCSTIAYYVARNALFDVMLSAGKRHLRAEARLINAACATMLIVMTIAAAVRIALCAATADFIGLCLLLASVSLPGFALYFACLGLEKKFDRKAHSDYFSSQDPSFL